jgi:hypothetical protein
VRSSGNWGLVSDDVLWFFLSSFDLCPSQVPFTPNSAHRWRYALKKQIKTATYGCCRDNLLVSNANVLFIKKDEINSCP